MKPQQENETQSQKQAPVPAPVSAAPPPSTEFRDSVPDFDDSADLRDYIDVVLRHKWLILTVVAVVFVTTLIVSLAMKPIFKATGRLELSIRTPKVTKFEELAATQMQTMEFIQTQVKKLQSDSLASRVIEKMHLEENPVFNPSIKRQSEEEEEESKGLVTTIKEAVSNLKNTVSGWLVSKPEEGGEEEPDPALAKVKLYQSILGAYLTNLEVQPERNTSIVSLSFKCTDPQLTRDIVNKHIQEFISWQMDKRLDAAGSAREQLEKQLEVARINLEKAERELNRFAQKAGIVSLDSNLNLIYKQLEEMNNALAQAQADRMAKEALFQQANKENVASLPLVLQNGLIQQLKQELVKVQAEYQDLYATFKEDYPRLKNLRARMTDIERRIQTEQNRILDSIKNDYETAMGKEQALKKRAEEMKKQALELNNQATQFKILEREVETSKFIHQSLMERAKEIDAQAGVDVANVQVIDYAALPLKPFKPNIRLNLLLALVVGAMGGVGLAFFLEYLDNTVKRIEEISDRFQIPVIGVLPLVGADESQELENIVQVKPRAPFSEAVRTTKVSIQLSSAMDQPPKAIMITSASASEGKTTISCNLAHAFVGSEERVIIIDADLRKPRLHRVFSSNGLGSFGRRKGLSQLLSGMCKIEEAVQKTDFTGLDFIPAGPTPPNPAELLASNRMKNLLATLGNVYDRIIVDAPPAAGFADVLVLGNCVDGVILVSTLGETHREALRIFRRSLFNVGGRLLGCIVNKLNVSSHYGGYYYKYYRYYHSYYQPSYREDQERLPEETLDVREQRV